MPAIEQLTADGVNVNVTLLFSVERYEQVIEAYLTGLERRADGRGPLRRHLLGRLVLRIAGRREGPRRAAAGLPVARRGRDRQRAPRLRALPASASPASAGTPSAPWGHAGNDRCGRAPAPRTAPSPTCTTSGG